ncbi:hypothetical protein F5884DRAFT_822345 [Xylogone sp. PMI_703]|nr:hypothetical protein F5884DRAFT_822345 [Xylogone sp. PMI_703]
MIETSIAKYVFIRSCIFVLHSIAPASLLYCLLLISPLPTALSVYRLPFYIEVWPVAEAAFFIIFFLPYKYHLQRPAIHPDRLSREERAKLFERCNTTVKDPERYLRQWFLNAEERHVKRENVKEFIRWAFLNAGQPENDDDIEDEVEGYVNDMEKLLGRDIPPGKGSAKSLRLTVDKVDFLHRSLLWYLCIFVVDTATCCLMLYNGFHFHRSSLTRFFMLFPLRPLTLFSAHRSPVQHLTYWHRPHSSKTKLPVLFIHGIGVGLYPYTNFLRDLNKATELGGGDVGVGIIALEIMPVSSRITHPALEKDAMVREVEAIVKHHGWSEFVLVSHSYGSIISTHLLKSPLTAPLVGPIVLVDPITFLLHLPDVAYNFTVRQPVHANEYLFWYFGSKDVGVAHSLGRRFFWSQNIIWKEDLEGRRITVVLSGKDLIVNTKAVKGYLTTTYSEGFLANGNAVRTANREGTARIVKSGAEDAGEWITGPRTGSGLEVLWFEHLDHAQVFDFEKTRRSVVETVRLYSVKRGKGPVEIHFKDSKCFT